MELPELQRDVLAFVRGGAAEPVIGMGRRRELALEHYCALTSRLLKRLGCFQTLVAAFFACSSKSPSVDRAGIEFLSGMASHSDPLISSLARLEYALLHLRKGEAREYRIDWDRNPEPVLTALLSGGDLPAPDFTNTYFTTVSSRFPELIRFSRTEAPYQHLI
jgi:hypothetical protein